MWVCKWFYVYARQLRVSTSRLTGGTERFETIMNCSLKNWLWRRKTTKRSFVHLDRLLIHRYVRVLVVMLQRVAFVVNRSRVLKLLPMERKVATTLSLLGVALWSAICNQLEESPGTQCAAFWLHTYTLPPAVHFIHRMPPSESVGAKKGTTAKTGEKWQEVTMQQSKKR